MTKYLILLFLTLTSIFSFSQYRKDGYQFENKIKAPRVRRRVAHEIMLDPQERFFIVNYSSYPAVVVLYDIPTWKVRASFDVPAWFDLGNSFVGPAGKFLYLDFARFSSKYRRIDLETNVMDTVECYKTPRGCSPKEAPPENRSFYTKDKKYFISVNKRRKSEILIFEKIVK